MTRHVAIFSLGLLLAIVCSGKPLDGSTLKPVLLVPGLTGSQLEVKLDDSDAGERLKKKCGYGDEWERIWIDHIEMINPYNHECWVEIMKLHYDSVTDTFNDAPGVQIRASGWGDTFTIEFVDPSWSAWMMGVGEYFHRTVQELQSWGYVRGKNLLGTPYDFRHAPCSPVNDEFYEKLVLLIEQAYNNNKQQKVVLVAHSLGGLYMHHFLVGQPSQWKTQYIDSLVTVAVPWKGAPFSSMVLASGYDFDVKIELFDRLLLRQAYRGFESNVFLLPHKDLMENRPIIFTPERNYTSADNLEFLKDIGFEHGPEILRQLKATRDVSTHPGVTVHCMYNTGVPTADQFNYGPGEFPDQDPERIFGDGDGTVPSASLEACSLWKQNSEWDSMTHLYHLKATSNHRAIIYDPEFLANLKDVVTVKVAGKVMKVDSWLSWFQF